MSRTLIREYRWVLTTMALPIKLNRVKPFITTMYSVTD